MKRTFLITAMLALTASGLEAATQETLLLGGWRFEKGAHQGAEATGYDDSRWQQVTIPHDWAIAGPFDKEIDKQVVAITQNGEKEATEKTGRSGSLPWIGEGWYRTTFRVADDVKFAELVFDGAMAEPVIYVNGQEAGLWKYGYSNFRIDISALVKTGADNTLAVHLQNVDESSRWYPGAGLYRPVRLVTGGEVGLVTWGTFARTTDLVSPTVDGRWAREARLTVSSEVRGAQRTKGGPKYHVRHSLLAPDGTQAAGHKAELNDSHSATNVLVVTSPELWNPEHPVLYTLVTEVLREGEVIDRQQTAVGIRTLSYTSEGFKLNGVLRKFKGVCLHHDLGPLGAAFNKAAFRRQVRLLQSMGCDAIRTSHNMPAPWQLDICDEMGMMVMAESFDMWVYPKCKNGYAKFFNEWWERDITNLVLAHRNHPSVVMWSIGNEIPDQGNATGLKYTRLMQNLIHQLDDRQRPVTQGFDRGMAPMWAGTWQEMDVPGFNYRLHVYEDGYENAPHGFVLGSETTSTVSSRGVYKFPVEEVKSKAYDDGQCSGYDVEACSWSNLPDDDWAMQEDKPWVIGEFVWTGFDYLGEPTPYDEYWPSRSSYFGIFDLAGLPKDRYWLYRSHWLTPASAGAALPVPADAGLVAPDGSQTLHLVPHWTWPGREGEVTPVFCYTNYPEAELFVNGKSQGRARHSSKNHLDRFRLRWMNVKYEPGELRVVAYQNGQAVAEQVVRTAGKPHHIELLPDRRELTATPLHEGRPADSPDLAFVTVRVVDKDGRLCPDADVPLTFKVNGKSARYLAACNGDATSLEPFTQPAMHTFHGELVVVVEATAQPGTSTLTVGAQGVRGSKLTLVTQNP